MSVLYSKTVLVVKKFVFKNSYNKLIGFEIILQLCLILFTFYEKIKL